MDIHTHTHTVIYVAKSYINVFLTFPFFNWKCYFEHLHFIPEHYGCPKACNTTQLYVNLMLSNLNTIIDPLDEFEFEPERFYLLSFYWDQLDIEEHHEALTYDFSSFLAAAGGNLGLVLGYSCLNVFTYVIELIFRKICS